MMRFLCWFRHPWRLVQVPGKPHILARQCTRCGARQRKVGRWWCPAGKEWGFTVC